MKPKLFLCINLVVISLIFLFGNSMTTTPGRSSGNGNPAIILLVPLFILFVILVSQWFYILKDKKIKIRSTIIFLLVIVCHCIVGMYYQFISHRNYRDLLAQVYAEEFGSIDWQYMNSITTGFSIHMNNQFFNLNTYLIFVSLSISWWLLSQIVKQTIKRNIKDS